MPIQNPPHPGVTIRALCLEPEGVTVTAAARRLGVSRKQLSAILNGRAGISPEMAVRLEKVFGSNARTWLSLQSSYDLAQVLTRVDEIIVPDLEPATT